MKAGSLKRHTVFNVLGSVVPLGISLATVPLLLREIGAERFGVLAIVWIIVGYFGVFDMGLSRTTANQIAKLQGGPKSESQDVFWTVVWMNACFGVIGALIIYFLAVPIAGAYLKMPDSLRQEVLQSGIWIAVAVPITTLAGVCVGVLEGRARFGIANGLQVFGTALLQIAPLCAAIVISPAVPNLVLATVAGRLLSGLLIANAAIRELEIRSINKFNRIRARELLGYSSWVTVTALISPMLETLDRILLGNLVGTSAVTYYSLPFSLVDKIRIFPRAMCRALFPELSRKNAAEARAMGHSATKYIAVAMAAAISPAFFIVGPFLSLWISKEFSAQATLPAQILLIGIWANGLALVPYTMLQAQGRPGTVAKFHAAEFLPFLIILWGAIKLFGVPGAAAAWMLRVILDAALLYYACGISKKEIEIWVCGFAILVMSMACARIFSAEIILSLSTAIVLSLAPIVWLIWQDPAHTKGLMMRLSGRLRG